MVTTTAFIEGIFANVLRRDIDPDGLAYWTGVIDGGVSREQALTAILGSPEAQGNSVLVARTFLDLLDRLPDPTAFDFWTAQIRDGLSPEAFVAEIAASEEFQSRVADESLEGFVARLYTEVLGRPAEPAGSAFWVNALQQGVSEAEVINQFVLSAENIATDAPTVHGALAFLGAQGRYPTAAEIAENAVRSLDVVADSIIAGGSIAGGIGDDVLNGSSGDDSITGDIGNDILNGGLGDDTLDGGIGDDDLLGGPGADTFVFRFDSSADGMIAGDDGFDRLTVDGMDSIRFIDNGGAITDLDGLVAAENDGRLTVTNDGGFVYVTFGAPSPVTLPPGRDDLDASGLGEMILLGVSGSASVTSVSSLASALSIEFG